MSIEVKENEIELEDYFVDAVAQYLYAIGKIPLLTDEEEKKYAIEILNGNTDAKIKMAEANLRLVPNVARRFIGRGLDFLELIQEGNNGLLIAVEKYDVTKGFKFSTFAIPCIRSAIKRAISNLGRSIRVPIWKLEMAKKLARTHTNLERKYGRSISVNEFSEITGISISRIYELLECLDEEMSLDDFVNDNDGKSFKDFIPSNNQDKEYLYKSMLKELVLYLKGKGISEKKIEIYMLRKGLNYTERMSSERIKKIFGLKICRSTIDKITKEVNAEVIEGLPNIIDPETIDLYLRETSTNTIISSSNNKNDNLYEFLGRKGYSEREIEIAISLLDEEKLNALYNKFGRDLKHPVINSNISHDEKGKFDRVMEKLKSILNRSKIEAINRGIVLENSSIGIYDNLSSEQYSKLLDVINSLEFKNVIPCLNENQLISIIFRIISNNLLEESIEEIKSKEIPIPTSRRNENLYEFLGEKGYSEREIEIAISLLDQEKLNALYNKFDIDLKHPIINLHMNRDEKARCDRVMAKLKRILNKNRVEAINRGIILESSSTGIYDNLLLEQYSELLNIINSLEFKSMILSSTEDQIISMIFEIIHSNILRKSTEEIKSKEILIPMKHAPITVSMHY